MTDGMGNVVGEVFGLAILGSVLSGGRKKTTTITKDKKTGKVIKVTEREGGGLFGNWF